MKKLSIAVSLFFTSICFSQTPLISKSLPNAKNGLHQKIVVWNISMNGHASLETVDYGIQTLDANDSLIAEKTYSYTRFNQPVQMNKTKTGNDTIIKPANMAFDNFKASAAWQKLQGLIIVDIGVINSIGDLQKLNQ